MFYRLATFRLQPQKMQAPAQMKKGVSMWDAFRSIAATAAAAGAKAVKDRTTLPNTKDWPDEKKYDFYAKYVELHGTSDAKKALADGKQVILALRIPTNTRTNQGQGIFDDRMVLLWIDSEKKKHAEEFSANTEPSAQYEQRTTAIKDPTGKVVKASKVVVGNDPNKDGRLDAGELAPGTYKYKDNGGFFPGRTTRYLAACDDQVALRDTNHDGLFDFGDCWDSGLKDPEGLKILTNKESGNFGMHIHTGANDNTWSAGCQTLPTADYTAFFNCLQKQTEYYYVLFEMR